MPDAVTHPTPQELTAFDQGKLPEGSAAAVARHLEACPTCRKAVEHLPPDSFIRKLRAAKPGSSSPPPGRALTRVAGAPRLVGNAAAPPAPPDNLPPELANHPKYRIVRELGRGGMGVVYQAVHTHMDRPVALKVINPALLQHPDALPRFQAEVKAAAKLDHPNIVRAYDAEQVGDLHLLVMEFVDGLNLFDLVNRKGPLPVAHACHYARQAALGLQHAFEQGMVHRDIKPHNLMLAPRGLVKVLDFGLARLRSEGVHQGGRLTTLGSFMGTPEYVSPEQATDARTADTRADLYSLGCTLYFLLAGRPPFQEDTDVKLVLAQIEKEPQALHEVRPDVQAGLSVVVARLLAKDPEQRYQKPVEVAQALVPFIKAGAKRDTKVVSAPPPGMASPSKGTMIGGDTSKVTSLRKDDAGWGPVEAGSGKAAPADPVEKRGSAVGPSKTAKKRALTPKDVPEEWYRRKPAQAAVGAAVVVLALGAWLLGGVIFRAKVKTADGEAFIVLEVDQPGSEVLVDGQKVTVNIPGGNQPVEIKVEPGRHALRISKDGFVAVARDIELKTGKSNAIQIRLEPVQVATGNPGKLEPPAEPTPPPQTGQAVINSIGMKLVPIPAGTFTMGSPEDEVYCEPLDKGSEAQHEVEITRPFYLGAYEVTQQEYEKVMGTNPSYFSPQAKGKEDVKGLDTRRFPVESVSWEGAVEFCRKLSALPTEKEANRAYRLPTEAEWEYACRGGARESLPFHFGRSLSSIQANFNGLSPYGGAAKGPNLGRPTAVGSYEANAFGLFDMHGNVWEWCADYYDKDYYSHSPRKDPLNDQKSTESFRVLRGGCWFETAVGCRAGGRNWNAPGYGLKNIGFRVVLSSVKLESLEVATAKPGTLEPPAEPTPPPQIGPQIGHAIINALGMKLVLIPAGKFLMGSPKEERDRHDDEEEHEVEITSPFYLGAYEVTQGEYEQVMGSNPSYYSSIGAGKGKVLGMGLARLPVDLGGMDTRRFPVETVSWEDATLFCRKLSELPKEQQAGRRYRVPTEAEWERACRGGSSSSTPFHFGQTLSSFQANFGGDGPYGDAPIGPSLTRPTTVGSYRPNDFGLYDMHGNVWEWCADYYHKDYYRNGPGKDPENTEKTNNRIRRGGSAGNDGRFCRTAVRFVVASDYRGSDTGFRVVMSFAAKLEPVQDATGKPGKLEPPAVNGFDQSTRAGGNASTPVMVWNPGSGKELRTLKGHTDGVHSVAFSPDGQRLASASRDKTIKIWNAGTGKELLTLKGHTDEVWSVAFSPDGQRLASTSGDQTIKIWDAGTGKELLTIKVHTGRFFRVTFSPDGKRLAIDSSGNTIKVWDAGTGQELLTLNGHTSAVNSVAFSPDGQRLASGSEDQTIKIWDAGTGQELLTLKGHTDLIRSVDFSPDGKRLASASGDKTIKVWDAGGQELLTLKGHTAQVWQVAFSPDGKRLASASSDETIKIWDAGTGQELLTLKGHKLVWQVAFSPDGKRLASAYGDATIKIWDGTALAESSDPIPRAPRK